MARRTFYITAHVPRLRILERELDPEAGQLSYSARDENGILDPSHVARPGIDAFESFEAALLDAERRRQHRIREKLAEIQRLVSLDLVTPRPE